MMSNATITIREEPNSDTGEVLQCRLDSGSIPLAVPGETPDDWSKRVQNLMGDCSLSMGDEKQGIA